MYEIARAVKNRLTTNPEDDYGPVWSPNGRQLAFTSLRGSFAYIVVRQAAGGGEAKELSTTPLFEYVSDWSRDGKHLLYHRLDPTTGADVWYLELGEGGSAWEPHPFLQTLSGEFGASFSPDSRYVAYVSNESGGDEVYVQPFPQGGRKVTVSRSGGAQVRWSRDGKELFYVEGSTLVAVPVSMGPTLSLGAATRLFKHPGLAKVYPLLGNTTFDVSSDRQRFVVAEPLGEQSAPLIRVVQNWYEEFRGRE